MRDIIDLIHEFSRLRAAQDNSQEAVEFLALVIQHPVSKQTRWLEGRIRDSAKSLLAKLKVVLSPETYTASLDSFQGLDLDDIVAGLTGLKS